MKSKKDKRPRRKYKSPKLIEYGAVNEITKGSAGSFPEGVGGADMMAMA